MFCLHTPVMRSQRTAQPLHAGHSFWGLDDVLHAVVLCALLCPGLRLQADFQHITTLSEELLQEPRQYNVATCMFAIHYFFDKPESLKTLLQTVAANLTDGGCKQQVACARKVQFNVVASQLKLPIQHTRQACFVAATSTKPPA